MPQRYEPIRKNEIDATQFTNWESALEIIQWLSNVYYVPAGHEHPLRTQAERNMDGKPSKNAPEFLVFLNRDGDDIRVDLKTWLIMGEDGKSYMYSDADFTKQYQIMAPKGDIFSQVQGLGRK